MAEIDFYFDIYSPYAYLGFHRLQKIAAKYQCKVNYLPIDLRRAKKAAGNTGPANVDIPPKIRYLVVDLKRWADRYGLAFAMPKLSDTSRINKGVLYAKARGCAPDYVTLAYDAVWGRGADPDSDEVLKSLAQQMGWNEAEFLQAISSEELGSTYEAIFTDAVSRGVFGVPIVMIGEQMWWGNDRMFLVEEFLEGQQAQKPQTLGAVGG